MSLNATAPLPAAARAGAGPPADRVVQGRALARQRLRARRTRTRSIRRRVVGWAVALFVCVWIAIAALLVSGHDPALSRQRSAQVASAGSVTRASKTASTPAATSSAQGSGQDSAQVAVPAQTAAPSQTTAVQTGQS